jgi:transposase
VLDKNSGDSPQRSKLVEATARGFKVVQVTADKAYPSTANLEAIKRVGGTLYAAFKGNTTGAVRGIFEKAFHFFSLHREAFLERYHRRSMIEITFSAVKRRFGVSLRSKTDTALRNETLAKFVAHNLCCVISAVYELGIDPTFLGLDGEPDDPPRDVLSFQSAQQTRNLHNRRGQADV